MTIIPPALNDRARTSFIAIPSRARLSRKAGITPSPAVTTMSRRTAESRRRYGANRWAMRRRFARRCTGSAARSGASEAEWKNMPIVCARVRRVVSLRAHTSSTSTAVDGLRRRREIQDQDPGEEEQRRAEADQHQTCRSDLEVAADPDEEQHARENDRGADVFIARLGGMLPLCVVRVGAGVEAS